jgi:HEAT repeat protein
MAQVKTIEKRAQGCRCGNRTLSEITFAERLLRNCRTSSSHFGYSLNMGKRFGLILFGIVLAGCLYAQGDNGGTAKERISRIRDLSKKDASVMPVLAGYLHDPARDVRIEAVKAIVRIDTERSLEPLIEATHDSDEDVQIRATDGLVNFYQPGYVARGLTGPLTRGVRQMKGFFSVRNDQVIDASVQVRPDVAQAIADLVRQGASVNARANAALAAGILRDRTAVPALVDALHAKDNDLLFEALVALQKIKDPSAGPAVSFLAHDLDERIQATALETIGLLRSTSSAPDVRAALEHARSLRIRRAALDALAQLGQPEDRTTFQRYAEDKDIALRTSALEGLGRIREPEDFATLQKAFDEGDIDWRIHLAAAFAMVNEGKVDTGEFDPLPYLVENLRNRSRADVASAYLTELAARDNVRQALIQMIPQMDKSQKAAICPVLSAAGTPDAIEALNGLAKDRDADVAAAAAKAEQTAKARRSS